MTALENENDDAIVDWVKGCGGVDGLVRAGQSVVVPMTRTGETADRSTSAVAGRVEGDPRA